MSWTSSPPNAPGRYWWRAPDRHGRPEVAQYGLILVQWQHLMRQYPPDLRIGTVCSFNQSFGGETEGQGWSYSGGYTFADFQKQYPGVKFWPISECGPDRFLPDLPGKPDWTPPDPKEVEAKSKAAKLKAEQAEAEEIDERAEKIAEAKAGGFVLYECSQCEALWDEDEVVQVRECPHCDDERFDGTSEGQNCPTCNRRFTRNVTEHGCPDCLDEECEVLTETAPTPAAEPEKKRGRRAR